MPGLDSQSITNLLALNETWVVVDNSVGFLFSLFTTAVLTYFVWKVMDSFLDLFLGPWDCLSGRHFCRDFSNGRGIKSLRQFLTTGTHDSYFTGTYLRDCQYH